MMVALVHSLLKSVHEQNLIRGREGKGMKLLGFGGGYHSLAGKVAAAGTRKCGRVVGISFVLAGMPCITLMVMSRLICILPYTFDSLPCHFLLSDLPVGPVSCFRERKLVYPQFLLSFFSIYYFTLGLSAHFLHSYCTSLSMKSYLVFSTHN